MKVDPGIEIWIEIEHESSNGEYSDERLTEYACSYDPEAKLAQSYLLNAPGKLFTIYCDASEAFDNLSESDVNSIGFAIYLDGEYVSQVQARRGIPKVAFSGTDCKDGRGYFPFRFLEGGKNDSSPRNKARKKLKDYEDAITVHVCRYKTVIFDHYEPDKEYRAIDINEEPVVTSPVLGYGTRREYGADIIDTSHHIDPLDDIDDSPFMICQLSCRSRIWLARAGYIDSDWKQRKSRSPAKRKRLSSILSPTPLPPEISPDIQTTPDTRPSSHPLTPQMAAWAPIPASSEPPNPLATVASNPAVELLRQIAPNGLLDRYSVLAEKHGFEYDVVFAIPEDLLRQSLQESIEMTPTHVDIVLKWVGWQKSMNTG